MLNLFYSKLNNIINSFFIVFIVATTSLAQRNVSLEHKPVQNALGWYHDWYGDVNSSPAIQTCNGIAREDRFTLLCLPDNAMLSGFVNDSGICIIEFIWQSADKKDLKIVEFASNKSAPKPPLSRAISCGEIPIGIASFQFKIMPARGVFSVALSQSLAKAAMRFSAHNLDSQCKDWIPKVHNGDPVAYVVTTCSGGVSHVQVRNLITGRFESVCNAIYDTKHKNIPPAVITALRQKDRWFVIVP